MSTIFGALFFIILILMGFQLMLWNFIQLDAYNTVNASMGQRDQLALSENLMPINPGAIGSNGTGGAFSITVNNVGGVAVSIARVYITRVYNGDNLAACPTTICIAEPSPSTTGYTITNPDIAAGCVAAGSPKCLINVTGLDITCDTARTVCSIFRVVLATTRGRLFSLLYPWPAPPPITVNSGLFQTNIGPITVFFDFKSFNFTMASQITSQGAWVMPTNTPIVLWIKVQNAASDSDIKLRIQSTVLFTSYGAGGVGASTPFSIVDKNTLNPNGITAYNENTNPYILQSGSVNGPGPSQIIKFGAATQGTNAQQSFPQQDNTWIVYIGFSYMYKGASCTPGSLGYDPTYGCLQGQTVPFVAARTCRLYPALSCF